MADVYCRDGKLVMDETQVYHNYERRWNWEGGCTHGEFQQLADGVEIHWSIDIAGPDWLFVDLRETGCGLRLDVRHSRDGWLGGAYYANYAAMRDSRDEMAQWVNVMLGRLEDPNETMKPVPMQLVRMLDDPDWQTRERATLALRGYRRMLPSVCRDELTAEQICRLDAASR
jgi:hypothetical protein